MKNYLHFLSIALLSFFAVSGVATAQDRPTAESRAKALTQNMAQRMNITDAARLKQIEGINLRAAHAMDSLVQQSSMNTALINREGKKIDRQHDEALEEVLDIKEWSIYTRYKKEFVYAAATENPAQK